MIPITVWRKLEGDQFVHHHIEEGHIEGDKPLPKFPTQSGWLHATWEKEHCFLRLFYDRAPLVVHAVVNGSGGKTEVSEAQRLGDDEDSFQSDSCVHHHPLIK